MTYILPVLYVIVSYTFFLLAVHFGNAITLQIVSILLPFIMGIVNLIVVLTVGRKWSRKTLLNCTLIIKYGLIPFYLIWHHSCFCPLTAGVFKNMCLIEIYAVHKII